MPTDPPGPGVPRWTPIIPRVRPALFLRSILARGADGPGGPSRNFGAGRRRRGKSPLWRPQLICRPAMQVRSCCRRLARGRSQPLVDDGRLADKISSPGNSQRQRSGCVRPVEAARMHTVPLSPCRLTARPPKTSRFELPLPSGAALLRNGRQGGRVRGGLWELLSSGPRPLDALRPAELPQLPLRPLRVGRYRAMKNDTNCTSRQTPDLRN